MTELRGGFIDKNGVWVIEPKFESCRYSIGTFFNEGLANVGDGGEYGYIDKTGKFIIKPMFDEALPFRNGIARVRIGKWGIIDRTGKFVAQPIFDDMQHLSDGSDEFIPVKYKGKYGYIDKTGKFVIKPKFEYAYPFPFFNGSAFAKVRYKNKEVYIDKTGEIITRYDEIGGFRDGFISVKCGNKWGFITETENFIIEPKYDGAGSFHDGIANVKIGDKWGFIDKTGQFVIDPKFEDAKAFFEGMAVIECGSKYGYIDKTGNIVIEPKFEGASAFDDGIALVEYEGKYGLIDKTGKFIIEPRFDWLDDFHEGLAIAGLHDKCFFIDKTGKIIIGPVYTAHRFNEGLAYVTIKKESFKTPTTEPSPSYSEKQNISQTKLSSKSSSETSHGCYIATAVYGSYDCPEVWTLRRYRDNVLDSTWYGRLFIRTYYAISPTLVKWFGTTNWFKKLWSKPLDKLVASLKGKGVENTPYNDKY